MIRTHSTTWQDKNRHYLNLCDNFLCAAQFLGSFKISSISTKIFDIKFFLAS